MLFLQKHKSPASLINPVKSNRLWLDRQGLCLWVSPHLEKHQTPRAEHKSEAADLLVDLLPTLTHSHKLLVLSKEWDHGWAAQLGFLQRVAGLSLSHRWGAQEGLRAEMLILHNERSQVARAFGEDEYCMHPSWGISSIFYWEEAQRQNQDILERLHLSAGLGSPWCLPEELEELAKPFCYTAVPMTWTSSRKCMYACMHACNSRLGFKVSISTALILTLTSVR